MAMKNVTVINAETIEHKGKRYTKVGSDVVAKKGDVIKRKDSGLHWFTKDAFYKVKHVDSDGDVRVKDDDREKVAFLRNNGELFREVSEQHTPVTPQVGDVVTFEGFDGEYRKVERKAQAGDVVVPRNTKSQFLTDGKAYQAVANGGVIDNDGDGITLYSKNANRTPETVDVYEKVEAKYVPQEGDIVVITGNRCDSRNAVGDIGKITKVKSYGINVEVPSKPDGSDVNGNSHLFDEVRKATPAEVEAYEKAVHKASFSVGDYVKIVKSFIGIEGDIVKITDAGAFPTPKGIADFVIEDVPNKREGIYGVFADQIVKATEQEVVDASKPKLKAGDFVKITRRMAHYNNDKIYEVIESDGRLGIIDEDIEFNPGAIFGGDYVLVSAEEAAKYADEAKWAQIGRNPFEMKKGDVVRVTDPCGAEIENGRVFIAEHDGDIRSVSIEGWHVYTELIAPVESTLK